MEKENKERAEKEKKAYRAAFFWIILFVVLIGVRHCTRQELRRTESRSVEMANIVRLFSTELNAVWARSDSAANLNTPIEKLKVFARDDEGIVRVRVAANPNTPVEILNELAKDSVQIVLIGVAANPNTPVETLRALAERRSAEINAAIANNPNAPAELRSIVQ